MNGNAEQVLKAACHYFLTELCRFLSTQDYAVERINSDRTMWWCLDSDLLLI